MTLVIRRANEADYPRISDIFQQVNDLHAHTLFWVFNSEAQAPYPFDEYKSVIKAPSRCILTATQDNDLVGYIDASTHYAFSRRLPFFEKQIEIEMLGVDEKCRRQGIGKALMARVEAWAMTNKADRLFLNVFMIDSGAITAYKKAGYSITGYPDRWSRKMEKQLNPVQGAKIHV